MIIQSYYRLLSSAESRRRKKLKLKQEGKSTKSEKDQALLSNPNKFSSSIVDSPLGLVFNHPNLVKIVKIGSYFKDSLKLYKEKYYKNDAISCAKLENELVDAAIVLSTTNILPNSFKSHSLKGTLAGLGDLHLFNRQSDTILLYDYKKMTLIDRNTKERVNINYVILYGVVSHEILDNKDFQKNLKKQRSKI